MSPKTEHHDTRKPLGIAITRSGKPGAFGLTVPAKLLTSGTDLVVVCTPGGLLAGVITKTDVVEQISQCQGAACIAAASLVMTHDVVVCRPGETLQDVSDRMKARGLKNIPVVDEASRPLGVLTARAILGVLVHDLEYEEALLTDYVKGVGYR